MPLSMNLGGERIVERKMDGDETAYIPREDKNWLENRTAGLSQRVKRRGTHQP